MKEKNKKSVKMTQFCPDPPRPSVEKIHTFYFFFFEGFPKSCKSAKKFFSSMGGSVPPYLKVKFFWTY